MSNKYSRNDTEIALSSSDEGRCAEDRPRLGSWLVRIELFGDEVEAIGYVDSITGEILQSLDAVNI